MQQTLYAILAMIMATLFAVNHNRAILQVQQVRLQSRLELMAGGLMAGLFSYAESRPFDYNGVFGAPGVGFQDAEDLDDLHNRSQSYPVPTENGEVVFDIEATVRYVEKSGSQFVAAAGVTPYKELELRIQGPLNSQATLRRVYSDISS